MGAPHLDIPFTQYLDAQGRIVRELPAFARDRRTVAALYRAMLLARTFDEKAIALQRTGRLGTYGSSLGQEAVSVGAAHAMEASDVLVPSFREQGGQLVRGVSLVELLQFWGGDERGSDYAGPREDFPVAIPVGSHAPHAAGVALAFKLRRERRAVVCIFGDGATSKGDVAEALNMAGVWQLPVVFVVTNNRFAISVPVEHQTAAATLAQKAIAAGIPGEQVDGNDVVAVTDVVARALEHARSGAGATLIEALTYRLGDHTTSDDASRYRSDDEVAARWHEEPLLRTRAHLAEAHGWTKDDEEQLVLGCASEVDAAVAGYLALAPPAPESMFAYTYAHPPVELAEQARRALGEG